MRCSPPRHPSSGGKGRAMVGRSGEWVAAGLAGAPAPGAGTAVSPTNRPVSGPGGRRSRCLLAAFVRPRRNLSATSARPPCGLRAASVRPRAASTGGGPSPGTTKPRLKEPGLQCFSASTRSLDPRRALRPGQAGEPRRAAVLPSTGRPSAAGVVPRTLLPALLQLAHEGSAMTVLRRGGAGVAASPA